jgi:hypothetical protein
MITTYIILGTEKNTSLALGAILILSNFAILLSEQKLRFSSIKSSKSIHSLHLYQVYLKKTCLCVEIVENLISMRNVWLTSAVVFASIY